MILLIWIGCFKYHNKLQSHQPTAHPSLFPRTYRQEITNENLLWFVQGYYGINGFEITRYEVQNNHDQYFLTQTSGSYPCNPPLCTALQTEPNHPPEIAFWQSLITHFTYFSPTDMKSIEQQGWGTINHTQKSLVKEYEETEAVLHEIIETEMLEFIPQKGIHCVAHTKIYTEDLEREIDTNSIDEWFIQNGYKNPKITYQNIQYSNEFIFAQSYLTNYQLILIFEDTLIEGGLEQFSHIELTCESEVPIYAKMMKHFNIVKNPSSKEDRSWNYQLLHDAM
jgi:hypothetical protein